MGIQFANVDKDNVLAIIFLCQSANILSWIPQSLVTREVCLVAVQVNGLALKFVPNKLSTRKIRRTAIWGDHQALWSIPRDLMDRELIDVAFESLVLKCKAARFIKF